MKKDLRRFFIIHYSKKKKTRNWIRLVIILGEREGRWNACVMATIRKTENSIGSWYRHRERVIHDVCGFPMRRIDNIHTVQEVSRNCHTIRVPTSRRTWCYAGKHVGSLSIFLSHSLSLSRFPIRHIPRDNVAPLWRADMVEGRQRAS